MKTPKAIKLPSGSWRCQVMINGKSVSIVRDTKREAEADAIRLKLDAKNPEQSHAQRLKSTTYNQAISDYIERRSNVLSPSTIRGYRIMQRHRFHSVMDLYLALPVDWQKIVNAESKLVGAKTVRNAWGLIASVLSENNMPVPNVRLPAIVKKEHEFLQPEELKRFVEIIHGEKYELAYLLCIHGLRRSEMLAVEKKDVKDGYIHVAGAIVPDENNQFVHKKENKTFESQRYVPVMISRVQELAEQSDNGRLCGWNPEAVKKRLDRICKENDLPKIGLHGLRHSFASLCYHLNISELQTMKYGGWCDINVMKKIYTHLAEIDEHSHENKLKSFFA